MKKLIIVLIAVLSSNINASAQRTAGISGRIENGKKLREKYPNEDYVSTESKTEISFEFGLPSSTRNKSAVDQDGNLQSNIKTTTKLTAVKDNINFGDRIYYSAASTVNSILRFDANNVRTFVIDTDNAYESNEMFDHDLRYREFSFNLGPMGEESSYEVKETYKDLKYVTSFFFNEGYVVEKKSIIIKVPSWLEIEIKEFNFEGFGIVHTETKVNERNVDYTRHEFTANNLKKLEREVNAVKYSFNFPHIVILSKAYTQNGNRKALIGTTDDLYSWYSSLTKNLIYNDTSYTNKTNELIKSCKSDEEKIKTIYYWVQDNIKYIAFESGLAGFKPMEAALVYKNRFGDCKGMANLLKAMLKSAGFDARLTWIGTADIPYNYSLPSICVDNHMICSLKHKDKWYFLDGTEKYQNLGSNAFRIRGRQVLIENPENKAFIETVPENFKLRDLQSRKINLTVSGNKLIGSADILFTGEEKNRFLYYKNYISKEDEKKINKVIFANNDPSISINNIECFNCNQRDSSLKFKYDFEAENKVNEFDNELYIDFDLDKEFVDFEKDTNRTTNVTYHEYVDIKTQEIIAIPTGYKVKHLPTPVLYNNDQFVIFTHLENKQGKLIYNKEIKILKGIITLDHYKDFVNAMEELKTFYKDQIIFEK